MKKFLTFVILFAISFFCLQHVFAGETRINTFYPSPTGIYNKLRLMPFAFGTNPTGNCPAGTLYVGYETPSGPLKLYMCAATMVKDVFGPWNSSGSNVFLYNNSANVGIGINNPSEKLSVSGNVSATGNFSGSTYLIGSEAQIVDINWAGVIGLRGQGANIQIGGIQFGGSGATGGPYIYGKEDASGNKLLGISTNIPDQALTVDGAISTRNYGTNGDGLNYVVGNDAEIWDVNEVNTLGIKGKTNANRGAIRLGGAGPLLYGDSSGWLGIGSTQPYSMLDVAGGIRANKGKATTDNSQFGYSFDADGDTGLFASGGTANGGSNLMLLRDAADVLFITNISSQNRVGIGTTVPKANLDVNGEIKVGNSAIDTCDASREGTMRYNATNKNMEFCNATSWEPMGGWQPGMLCGLAVVNVANAIIVDENGQSHPPKEGKVLCMGHDPSAMTNACPTGFRQLGGDFTHSGDRFLYSCVKE